MEELEQEALLLNREMLTEVKNLIDDINDTKPPHYLKQFIHPQWGSIIGNEKGIRLAVLKDEVAHLKSKLNDEDTSVSILKTTISTLNLHVKELEKK